MRPPWILRGSRENSGRTGLPRKTPLPLEVDEGRLEGGRDFFGPAEQAPVGEARNGVLFQEEDRDFHPRGGQHDRSRAVRADADDEVRTDPAEDAEGPGQGEGEKGQAFQAPQPRPFRPSTLKGMNGTPWRAIRARSSARSLPMKVTSISGSFSGASGRGPEPGTGVLPSRRRR